MLFSVPWFPTRAPELMKIFSPSFAKEATDGAGHRFSTEQFLRKTLLEWRVVPSCSPELAFEFEFNNQELTVKPVEPLNIVFTRLPCW